MAGSPDLVVAGLPEVVTLSSDEEITLSSDDEAAVRVVSYCTREPPPNPGWLCPGLEVLVWFDIDIDNRLATLNAAAVGL